MTEHHTPAVLASSGTFVGMPNGRNIRLLEEILPALEADGMELMLYDSWYSSLPEIVRYVKSLQGYFPVLHAEKSIGMLLGRDEPGDYVHALELFRQNAWAAAEVGAKKMVLHLWNGPVLDTHIEKNLSAFGDLQEIAREYGQELTVENVVCHGLAPDAPLCYLADLRRAYPDATFTYDLKMAEFHGQNALVWKKEWQFLWEAGVVTHLHVSDYAGGLMDFAHLRTRHLGEGHIDFVSFFQHYNRTPGCDTLTLEPICFREDGSVDVAAMNRDIRRVRELLTL